MFPEEIKLENLFVKEDILCLVSLQCILHSILLSLRSLCAPSDEFCCVYWAGWGRRIAGGGQVEEGVGKRGGGSGCEGFGFIELVGQADDCLVLRLKI